MKKLLAVILSLCLCLSAMTALAETTLKLGVYPEDVKVAEVAVHEEVFIPAFEQAMPDVKLERAHYEYQLDTFMPLVESGNLPTVFPTWYTEPQKLIRAGTIADITDYLEELDWLDKMNPSVRALLSDENGRVYGTPRDGYALGLMINAELFRDAGLVDADGIPLYPKTWDELIEVGKTIKEETGSAALVYLGDRVQSGWHFTNVAWTFGAEFETQDADGKWAAHIDTPEVLAAMELLRDLKWEHDLLTSDPLSENWGTGFAQLGTGAAAMYMAANDAVEQPTANNGLPVEDLMMVGIPAGPAGSYSLSGGTPFVFAADATPEEIVAGLKYLEIMGRSPVLNDVSRQGLIEDAKNRVDKGIPVIREFPAWIDEEIINAKLEVVAEYANVDPRMFDPYFDATSSEGNLKMEEPMMTQELYGELGNVIQEIFTNENADIPALLAKAQANFQKMLDDEVNNK